MPPKRKAEIEAELQQQTKRLKDATDTVASEFMCAISHELPLDPVTAEDGQVYERGAIEAWIARAEADESPLKSPKHNTPMGPRLFPSTQARNIIEQMVRTGAISGPNADAWLKKLADEKEVKELRAKAEGGDAAAMYHLGRWYFTGDMGLSKDLKQATGWWQRGYELGHATCTSELGLCYARGEGVEKEGAHAACLYGIAAARGSESGCFRLAHSFANGLNGLPMNAREATRWFRAMESATTRRKTDHIRDKAAKWLSEHAME